MNADTRVQTMRGLLDDLLRSETGAFLEEISEYDDNPPRQVVLGDWAIVTHWISVEDPAEDHYYLLDSGMSSHASRGLLAEFAGE